MAALEATVCSKTAKPLTLVLPMKCDVAAAGPPQDPMGRVGGVGAVSVCAGGVVGGASGKGILLPRYYVNNYLATSDRSLRTDQCNNPTPV